MMKLKFKIQQYQTDAVENVVKVDSLTRAWQSM